MTLKQAEDEIRFMIDNKIVYRPTLEYYDSLGRIQLLTVKYSAFKRYIDIIKDSVNSQIEKDSLGRARKEN